MIFMLSMTLWALAQLAYQSGLTTIGIISSLLLILALILVYEAAKIVMRKPAMASEA